MAAERHQSHDEQSELDPRQNPLIGCLWRVVGVILALGVVGVGMSLSEAARSGPLKRSIGLLTLMVAFYVVATFWLWGKQHVVPLGEEVRTKDSRRPILYLRSFAEENTVAADEYALAKIMGEEGPFVAIGQPGDPVPPLGASRFYVADSDWQEFVTQLLDESVMVLVLAGRTQGLGWELRQCKKHTDPHRLIVLVPNDRELYETFRDQVASKAEFRLPEFPDNPRFLAGDLVGLVKFDKRWRGKWIGFERAWLIGKNAQLPSRISRRVARLQKAFSSAYRTTGISIEPPGLNVNHVLMMLLIGVALVGFGVLLMFALSGAML